MAKGERVRRGDNNNNIIILRFSRDACLNSSSVVHEINAVGLPCFFSILPSFGAVLFWIVWTFSMDENGHNSARRKPSFWAPTQLSSRAS